MFGLGKKTIALAMAAAVIISGFAFPSAKTVKAADPEPTVKVLGATLRTDGNTVGTQSLRVGIEVSNASYASNCGIKIKIKDSASDYKVVSTADEKYQKIYSKDAAEDKIVYSVVVENIPVDYASSEIEFIGFVNKLETPAEIYAQTDAVAKSVSGVVQSISDSLGQDVILLDSGDYAGTLVYEYARLDMSAEHSNLEMPDKEGDYSSGAFVVGKNDARAECEYVVSGDDAPYYKVITPAAGDGTENTQGKGIGYIHPSMATTDSYIYSAEVKADTGIAINLVPYWGWNTWKEAGHEGKAVNCNGEWTKFEVKTSNQETWDASNYFSTAGDGGKEYCIKNVVIYKVFSDSDMPEIAAPPTGWNEDHTEYSIKLDDTSIWVNSNVTYSINQDGSVNFKVSGEDFGEFGFRIPESVYTTNRFTEAVIAYANNQMACGNHAIKYGTSNPAWGSGASSDDARYQGILSIGSGEASITPNHDVAFNQEYNNNFSAFRFFSIPVGNEITIKSITLKGLVETAQPAETPESYAIEGEALQNSYQGENGGPSSAEYDSADNVMNFSFTGYTGVIYSISDNTIDTSVYKYAQVTYTSSGGSLDVYACQADGTYPDNAAASLTATDTEKIVTVSGFGKGAIKLFHWGYNDDTNITIKSIKFYQNNPETVSEDENGIVMNIPSNYNTSQSGKNYGTFVKDEYYSTYTETNRPFNVILPYGYSESKKYPVIYMLHGIFGNQDAFGSSAESCSIVKISGNLCSDGDAKEAIIVIPSIRVCADSSIEDDFSADNYKLYDLFREDLIECLMPYMEANYSIATGRENTAIAGFSMGGRESLYIGISKADYFGYVGAFCPTYGIFKYEPNWTGVGEEGLFADVTSFTLPDQYMNNTYLMIVKGTKDTTVHEMPTTYHDALTSNDVPHIYYEVEDGGHDENTWGHGMYNFLRKVFK